MPHSYCFLFIPLADLHLLVARWADCSPAAARPACSCDVFPVEDSQCDCCLHPARRDWGRWSPVANTTADCCAAKGSVVCAALPGAQAAQSVDYTMHRDPSVFDPSAPTHRAVRPDDYSRLATLGAAESKSHVATKLVDYYANPDRSARRAASPIPVCCVWYCGIAAMSPETRTLWSPRAAHRIYFGTDLESKEGDMTLIKEAHTQCAPLLVILGAAGESGGLSREYWVSLITLPRIAALLLATARHSGAHDLNTQAIYGGACCPLPGARCRASGETTVEWAINLLNEFACETKGKYEERGSREGERKSTH